MICAPLALATRGTLGRGPAIDVLWFQDVDPRDKPGHDGGLRGRAAPNEHIPVVSPAAAPAAPPLPREGFVRLSSPLNRGRLQKLQGEPARLWSFWIFMVLFVFSLFAEFIANGRPIVASYKGEILYPVFVDYPEEKFGILAQTDYRDPLIQKELAENGWAIWPPIACSYRTHNLDLPVPAPAAPDVDALRRTVPPDGRAQRQFDLSRHRVELARTDDQGPGRRRPSHLRLSHLGTVRTDPRQRISSVIGVVAGAVQGYFGAGRSPVPAVHRGSGPRSRRSTS